jgi:hypothetical protein
MKHWEANSHGLTTVGWSQVIALNYLFWTILSPLFTALELIQIVSRNKCIRLRRDSFWPPNDAEAQRFRRSLANWQFVKFFVLFRLRLFWIWAKDRITWAGQSLSRLKLKLEAGLGFEWMEWICVVPFLQSLLRHYFLMCASSDGTFMLDNQLLFAQC